MEQLFRKLYELNVNDHIEKKGQFSYLSWPFAVAQLRLADPSATWEVKRFDGLPFLRTECGYFVEVAVTLQGVTLSQIHPVLDSRNQPMAEPSAFDLNTSIQRCLVKAIALHGLGLYIYAGEDLPQGEQAPAHQAPAPGGNVTPMSKSQITPAQLRYIEKLLAETGSDKAKLLAFFNVSQLEELSASAASRAIKSLEANRRKAA